MTSHQIVTEDPVVVYDVMREAANRLTAIYASRVTTGGVTDPAIIAIHTLTDEVNAVDPDNVSDQKAMTEKLLDILPALKDGDSQLLAAHATSPAGWLTLPVLLPTPG